MSVSIVITAYNLKSYVADAVRSALEQPEVDEVIVVDDGSTDGTIALLERIAATEPRVQVLAQVNTGTSGARNAGAQMARQDHLLFLDGDDCLLPGATTELLRLLRENPTAACAYGQWRAMRDDGQALPANMKLTSSYTGFVLKEILKRGFLLPGCVLMRREAFARAGGFDRELLFGEDWEFFCRLSMEGPFFPTAAFVMSYRIRGASKSGSANAARLQQVFKGVDRVFSNPKLKNYLSERERTRLQRVSHAYAILGVSTRSFWEGDRRGAMRTSWLAIKQCPTCLPRILGRYGLNMLLFLFARNRSAGLS